MDGSPEPLSLVSCVEGDQAAWRSLHRQYYPVAAAFLRKLGVDHRDLEDGCQDVFLQMFRYLPRFRGEAELKTWLYRLCITQARKIRLRRRLGDAVHQMLASLPGEDIVSSPAFCERTARQRMDAALSQLSTTERTVFVLYEMEGVPGIQIAEIMGCKPATLWRRLHYARKNFCKALELSKAAP
jgi:RNA polymerase sigma-70 factor (ECF subfamily)